MASWLGDTPLLLPRSRLSGYSCPTLSNSWCTWQTSQSLVSLVPGSYSLAQVERLLCSSPWLVWLPAPLSWERRRGPTAREELDCASSCPVRWSKFCLGSGRQAGSKGSYLNNWVVLLTVTTGCRPGPREYCWGDGSLCVYTQTRLQTEHSSLIPSCYCRASLTGVQRSYFWFLLNQIHKTLTEKSPA